MLKKLIKFNWDDFALLGGAAAGMFLLAQIVTALVLLFFRDRMGHVVLLSGVILPAVMGFVLLFTSLGHFMLTFDLGVRFSLTRRRSLGLTVGVAGLQALFAMAAAGLLARLEEALMPRAWKVLSGAQALDISVLGREPGGAARAPEPGAALPAPPQVPTLEADIIVLRWYWYLAIALGALALALVLAALLSRFGQKGMWILWGIWMAVCFLPQLPIWSDFWSSSRVPFPLLLPLAVLFFLGVLAWSVWQMLHAAVKG